MRRRFQFFFKDANLAAFSSPFCAYLRMLQSRRQERIRSRCHNCSAVVERIMDGRVYEIGMQTRFSLVVSSEKEKQIAFLFLQQNRYYSTGVCRINVKKDAAPFPPLSPLPLPLTLIVNGRTDRINTTRWNFQRVPTTSLFPLAHTIDSRCRIYNNDSCYARLRLNSLVTTLVPCNVKLT